MDANEEDAEVGASCRRIFNKSNGAVMARAPKPAAAPAIRSCQCDPGWDGDVGFVAVDGPFDVVGDETMPTSGLVFGGSLEMRERLLTILAPGYLTFYLIVAPPNLRRCPAEPIA
jgi:hypothetical protein